MKELPALSPTKFYPIILSYSYRTVILDELRSVLSDVFNRVEGAEEVYEFACDFLMDYVGNKNNYDSYRTDLVVFLNWAWANELDIKTINRKHMSEFVAFTNNPPPQLISRFASRAVIPDKKHKSELALNLDWAPFRNPQIDQPYSREQKTIVKLLSVVSSFYTYLMDCEYTHYNPAAVALRRLNIASMDGVKAQSDKDRSLSMIQLATLFDVLDELAIENPSRYERTRFLMHLLIFTFPRRSEVSASMVYSPMMSDFERVRVGDSYRYCFHIRKAKRGRSRKVVCPARLIDSLVRYRRFRGLPDLPDRNEKAPLFTRMRPASHGRSAGEVDANLSSNSIYEIVKDAFENTAIRLEEMEEFDEASDLRSLSTHSTRHTGISLALSSGRPSDRVMMDSGHTSFSAFKGYITNKVEFRFSDVDLVESLLDSI